MSKLWIPMGRWVLLLIALLVALAVLLPMRLAFGWLGLDDRGVSARAVHGSLWAGEIEQMRVGDISIGTLDAALAPFPLLVGRARLDLARDSGEPDGITGAITVSRNSIGIDDLTARLPAGRLLAPLPVRAIALDDVSIRFVSGACEHAEGRVHADISGAIPGLTLTQGLSGEARCDGDDALLALADQSGQQRLELRFDPSGTYTADALIAEPDPTIAALLAQHGFERVPGGYRLRATGSVR